MRLVITKHPVIPGKKRGYLLKVYSLPKCSICKKEIKNGEVVFYIVSEDGTEKEINCMNCTYYGNVEKVKIPKAFDRWPKHNRVAYPAEVVLIEKGAGKKSED